MTKTTAADKAAETASSLHMARVIMRRCSTINLIVFETPVSFLLPMFFSSFFSSLLRFPQTLGAYKQLYFSGSTNFKVNAFAALNCVLDCFIRPVPSIRNFEAVSAPCRPTGFTLAGFRFAAQDSFRDASPK
ncbi:MAG: hypothetical protein FWC27_05885 [Firmicutes bacterium]|nr:hypothetical protein [Bacillota bacterium]